MLFIYFGLMRIHLDSLVPGASGVFPPGTQPCGPFPFLQGMKHGAPVGIHRMLWASGRIWKENSHTLENCSAIAPVLVMTGRAAGSRAYELPVMRRAPRLVILRVLSHATCPGTDSNTALFPHCLNQKKQGDGAAGSHPEDPHVRLVVACPLLG